MLHESGMNPTILRFWYVLVPGHPWPYALIPVYWLFEKIPATCSGAERLGLVTLRQMTRRWFARWNLLCREDRLFGCPPFETQSNRSRNPQMGPNSSGKTQQ
jgi:hypothetical protein